MAKRTKVVPTSDGRDRRSTGYYATPSFVAEFLTREMLRINPAGRTVLDPCVGREELLGGFHRAGKTIDGMDVTDFGGHRAARFRRRDFLAYRRERSSDASSDVCRPADYDYYIANPPYNCHESDYVRRNKRGLERLFPRIGVGNMYSMFLSAMIDLARPGALIGAITLDSFLTGRSHAALREQILRECTVHALLLCPTDLFRDQGADVRTCVMILQKGREFQGELAVLNRPAHTQEFADRLAARRFDTTRLDDLVLASPGDRNAFVVGCPPRIRRLFRNERLADRYPCVAGISTGNDTRYLSPARRARFTVPFYKNPASRRFHMKPDAFLIRDFLAESQRIANFMVRNRDLLFSEGIACSSMGVTFAACYRPADAVFGVNPNVICPAPDVWWLLGYLNSSLVTYFVRGVLIRTNMITPGYAARIPLIPLSSPARRMLADVARRAHRDRVTPAQAGGLVERIDRVVFPAAGLGPKQVRAVRSFHADLVRLT